MNKNQKLIQKVISGKYDRNIDFTDLITLLIALGFTERIKGDHHIFTKKILLRL